MKIGIRIVVPFMAWLLMVPSLQAKTDAETILKKQQAIGEERIAKIRSRDGNAILSKADDRIDTTGALAKFDMRVYRKGKLRKTYKMVIKNRGTEKGLITFIHPPRNRGQKILKVKDNIWIYRPKINKVLRVSGRSSAVGSDFSNTDLLSLRLDRDYNAKLLDIVDYKGEKAYKLELLAKSEEVTYAKIIYWIRVKDYLPLKRDHYTLSGHKLKTLVLETTSNILEGLPDRYTMTNVMEKNKKTVLKYTYLKTNLTFPDKIFRKNSLKRKR